jgi:hypothetical protein
MATRKQQSAHCVRRRMRRVEAAGTESCQRRQLAIFECGMPWTKGGIVTAAHNACIRELLQEIDGHGKADRHMKLLTIETESRLGTLWDQEQCTQFCSKDELWEAAKEEEMKIPWTDAKEGSSVPEEQYQERFWRRRLDGIGLDMIKKELLAIEFKRTRDARSNHVDSSRSGAVHKFANGSPSGRSSQRVEGATMATPWRRALGPCRRTRRRRALVGRSHDDWKGMYCKAVTRLLIWDRTGPFVLDCDSTGPFVLDRD